MIGYTEVFAYDSLTNKNPVISSFAFRGIPVSLDGGVAAPVSFPYCTDSNPNSCPDNYAIVGVPDASWERDPQDPGPDGGPLGEQILGRLLRDDWLARATTPSSSSTRRRGASCPPTRSR